MNVKKSHNKTATSRVRLIASTRENDINRCCLKIHVQKKSKNTNAVTWFTKIN